jgi:2'-hydroxyisoflavone reductase
VRLLVLGGTTFVGRAVVEAAVERGWRVSTFNRGRGPWAHPAAEHLIGDRLRPDDLDVLSDAAWDAVVDTWAGAPRAVRDSARVLARRAARYLYVSSRSVYAPPLPEGLDERHATVASSSDAEATDYPQDKRGGELAVEAAFGDRGVFARAGLILGPHEDVGRLPYWLLRMHRGGRVLAPGPPDGPLRFIDVRDLAAWLLDAAEGEVSGAVNLVNPPGHATIGRLLEAAVAATRGNVELIWVDPDAIDALGIERWRELPAWLPPTPDVAGLLFTNVERAVATGLRCRPVEETVADTWAWLESIGRTPPNPPAGRPALGLAPQKEERVLTEWRQRTRSGATTSLTDGGAGPQSPDVV